MERFRPATRDQLRTWAGDSNSAARPTAFTEISWKTSSARWKSRVTEAKYAVSGRRSARRTAAMVSGGSMQIYADTTISRRKSRQGVFDPTGSDRRPDRVARSSLPPPAPGHPRRSGGEMEPGKRLRECVIVIPICGFRQKNTPPAENSRTGLVWKREG